ncbi:MAG: hypothetical protein AAGA66_00775 [Bacteroidota bacterium]
MKKTIFILFSFIALSCQDIDSCAGDSNLPFMVVRSFDIDTGSPKKIGNFQRITSEGNIIPFDSGFYSIDSTTVFLFLNPDDTITTYFFDSAESADGFEISDFELQMVYDPEFSIFDPECPPSILFTNLDTLKSTFDSTVISGRVTDRQLTSNVEVFF